MMGRFPVHPTIRTADTDDILRRITPGEIPCRELRNITATIRAVEADDFIFRDMWVGFSK